MQEELDFQGGSPESSFTSDKKDKLYKLPNDTVVYPAHNYEWAAIINDLSSSNGSEAVSKTKLNEYIQKELTKNRPYPKKFDIAVPANIYCGDSRKVGYKIQLTTVMH